jgi:hypothetical protein
MTADLGDQERGPDDPDVFDDQGAPALDDTAETISDDAPERKVFDTDGAPTSHAPTPDEPPEVLVFDEEGAPTSHAPPPD